MSPYQIPKRAFPLMRMVYRSIFPVVENELSVWEKRARDIPDDELRMQALSSIHAKRFHCLGGAVYAGSERQEAVRFIVSYQTICDYLDNLCDRSTSLDPGDFRQLHQALFDALTPENHVGNYYALRNEQNDGLYLADLVRTCQRIIEKYTSEDVRSVLRHLANLYTDLQVHKHVAEAERVKRLTLWHKNEKPADHSLSWYEFAAASGSTLGIFCIVSYAIGGTMTENKAYAVYKSYFPYVQGLHILMDYYIDQYEDEKEGDLNFCTHYPSDEQMKNRFIYFIKKANAHVRGLPNASFHRLVCRGLIGLYLADPKTASLAGSDRLKKELLRASGRCDAGFFHWNSKMYHRFKKIR